MASMFQRIRDLPDQGLYGVIGVLAVAALYVIGFVIKNSKNVSVDFVLFSAGVPLITLMVVMLLFGAVLGAALTLALARRRATPKVHATAAPHAPSQPPPVTPPPFETPAGTNPPPPGVSINLQVQGKLQACQPAESRATASVRRPSTSSGPPVLTARSRSTPSLRP